MRRVLKREYIYHIFNRGNHKGIICLDFEDYARLYGLVKRYFDQRNFDLISFCIMPNHFHLLVVQKRDYKISKSIQMITSKYATYINKKYKLIGHLFQGRYGYKTVLGPTYFNKLIKYIRDNPKKSRVRSHFIHEENIFLIDYYNFILRTK